MGWHQLVAKARAAVGLPTPGDGPGDHQPVSSCSACGARLFESADRCPSCGSLLTLQRFLNAIDAEDVAGVRAQLIRDPRLVDAMAIGGVRRTPLHRAAALPSDAMVGLLLAHGALVNAPDSFGATPLHMAAAHNRAAAALLLLAGGANPDARKTDQTTPGQLAAAGGHATMVELLRRWEDKRGAGPADTPRPVGPPHPTGEMPDASCAEVKQP